MSISTPENKKDRSDNGNGNQSNATEHIRDSCQKDKVTRHTYHARVDLLEKIRGYAYWERIGISELMNQILEDFFEGKEVQPTPRRKGLR